MSEQQQEHHHHEHHHHKNEDEVKVETLTNEVMQPISEERRFAIMTLGCLSTICVAIGYAFSLISQPLQQRYNLSMRDLTTINTVGLVVKYFTLPYAIGYDFLGPVFTSVLGAILLPLGAVLLCLCFRGDIEGSVARLSVFQAIFSLGCVMFDTTCIVTTVNHFPTNRGLAIAFLSTYGSLGSSMVACLYSAFFSQNTANYFFFLMAYGLVMGILCAIFMRHPSYYLTGLQRKTLSIEEQGRRTQYKAQYLRQKPTMYRFIYAGSIMIFLIIVLPVQSCVIAYKNLGETYKLAFAIIVMICTFLMLLTPVPFHRICGIRLESDRDYRPKETKEEEEPFEEVEAEGGVVVDVKRLSPTADVANLNDDFNVSGTSGAAADTPKVPKIETDVDYIAPQYQTSFWRNLRTLHLWAMIWALFSVVSTECTVISNAAYIYSAMNEKEATSSERAMLTAVNGSCSAVGRLFMSWLENWTQHRSPEKRIPITTSLYVPAVAILLTCIFFVALPPSAAVAPFITLGLGNGFQMASTILVVRTIYAKDLAAHYNFCLLATSIAAITCNRFLYGEWYAVQADKMGSLLCLKKKCIFMPFMVMGGLACTSFLAAFYIDFAYRRFSRKVLEERARIIHEQKPVPEGENAADDSTEEKNKSTVVAEFYATDAVQDQLEADLQRERNQLPTP